MKSKQKIYNNESRHLERLGITAVAITAVLVAILAKAKLLGEFQWHVGW